MQVTAPNLKEAREELGISQRRVARELGIDRAKLIWFERGRYWPERSMIAKLRTFYEKNGATIPAPDPEADAAEDQEANEAESYSKPETPAAKRQSETPAETPATLPGGDQAVVSISEALDDDHQRAINTALDDNEAAIADLAERANKETLSTDEEDLEAQREELQARLAAVGMLFYLLNGTNVLPAVPNDSELIDKPHKAATSGEVVAAQLHGHIAPPKVREQIEDAQAVLDESEQPG